MKYQVAALYARKVWDIQPQAISEAAEDLVAICDAQNAPLYGNDLFRFLSKAVKINPQLKFRNGQLITFNNVVGDNEITNEDVNKETFKFKLLANPNLYRLDDDAVISMLRHYDRIKNKYGKKVAQNFVLSDAGNEANRFMGNEHFEAEDIKKEENEVKIRDQVLESLDDRVTTLPLRDNDEREKIFSTLIENTSLDLEARFVGTYDAGVKIKNIKKENDKYSCTFTATIAPNDRGVRMKFIVSEEYSSGEDLIDKLSADDIRKLGLNDFITDKHFIKKDVKEDKYKIYAEFEEDEESDSSSTSYVLTKFNIDTLDENQEKSQTQEPEPQATKAAEEGSVEGSDDQVNNFDQFKAYFKERDTLKKASDARIEEIGKDIQKMLKSNTSKSSVLNLFKAETGMTIPANAAASIYKAIETRIPK